MSLFETGKRSENRLAFLLTLNFFYSNAGAIQTLKFTHYTSNPASSWQWRRRYIKIRAPQDHDLMALLSSICFINFLRLLPPMHHQQLFVLQYLHRPSRSRAEIIPASIWYHACSQLESADGSSRIKTLGFMDKTVVMAVRFFSPTLKWCDDRRSL